MRSKLENVEGKIKTLEKRKKTLEERQANLKSGETMPDAEKAELERVSRSLERENEKKKKLQQMQSEVQEKFRGMLGGPTYLDETADDQEKHKDIIDKIRKAIELEDAEGISYSEKNNDRKSLKKSIYDPTRTDVDDLFKNANNDKVDAV